METPREAAQTSRGWGIAAFVVALAIVTNAFIFYVHKQTYRHPTDPTTVNVPGESR